MLTNKREELGKKAIAIIHPFGRQHHDHHWSIVKGNCNWPLGIKSNQIESVQDKTVEFRAT